jgi:cob(I)alamin adenosyltransferase
LSNDFKGLLVKYFSVETVSASEELVKKVLKTHRGKECLEKAYRKLYDSAKDIAEELEKEIQKGKLKKESLDEKPVNAFIQYYALDHGIELDKKLLV